MKRILVIFAIILSTLLVYAEQDKSIVNALRTCTPYVSYGSLDVNGVSADYKIQIAGLDEQNRCVYRKYVALYGREICTVCKFTDKHVAEIIKLMNKHKVGYTEAGKEVDIDDLDTLKNTPVVKLWNSYLNNPNICNIEF